MDVSLEAAPSVLWDGVVLPAGDAVARLAAAGQAVEFLKDQYRHCKPVLAMGDASALLAAAGIPPKLPDGAADPALLLGGEVDKFIAALGQHRGFRREVDQPVV